MPANKFRAAVVAMTPDADPRKHRSVIETPLYSLTTLLVKDESEAIEECRKMVLHDGIQSFMLCPGFTNRGVAMVAEAVGDGVSVNVARGDSPSNAIARRIMTEVGFFEH